jgi:hypothetical protein
MLASIAFACVTISATPPVRAQNHAGDEATYRTERDRCASDPNVSDRAACQQSARAALQAAREGRLDRAPHDFQQNQEARCNDLPAPEHDECLRRVHGAGSVSGSVESGGTVRTLVTEPAPGTSPKQ